MRCGHDDNTRQGGHFTYRTGLKASDTVIWRHTSISQPACTTGGELLEVDMV